MRNFTTIDIIAFILVIIGAINWGLVGAFSFNLVDAIFQAGSAVDRIIYVLVGLAGIYSIYALFFAHHEAYNPGVHVK